MSLDFHISSVKMPDFADRNGKMGVMSVKMAVFADGGPGYLLYLHNLSENTNQHNTKWLNLKMEYPF